MEEIWKAVVGFENYYEVSSFGRVRSVARIVECNPRGLGVKTKTAPAKYLKFDLAKGYPRVTMSVKGKHTRKLVHHLVLEAFVGPRESEKMEGCHLDGNRTNNRADNLRWDTHINNHKDDVRNGTRRQGEKVHLAKLTAEKVIKIRATWRTGKYSLNEMGRLFGVHLVTIHQVIKRKTWKHVP